MLRKASVLAALAVLALVAAGCGVRSSKPFTATHVTTDPAKLDFIAGFAENGGLRATTRGGNVLTIAFAADEASAPGTKQAYRAHAPARLRPRMNDIMESQRNAVLVWTTSPSAQQLADAESCLHA